MHSGELLTRSTVWLALTLYVASDVFSVTPRHHERSRISWWLNAAGCLFFLGHVAAAFNYFYGWSHALAYADTARQSKELTGWNSGGGLYLNYIFALIWVSEVVWSRITPANYSSRPRFWSSAVRAFFLFMIFNGAFVFVRSSLRWFGLVLCLLSVASWWLRAMRSVDWRALAKSF